MKPAKINSMTAHAAIVEIVYDDDYVKSLPINERKVISAMKSKIERGYEFKSPKKFLEKHGWVCNWEPKKQTK